MLEESSGLRCNPPVSWIGTLPPQIHVATEVVYDRRRVVLLRFGREPLAFVEDELIFES